MSDSIDKHDEEIEKRKTEGDYDDLGKKAFEQLIKMVGNVEITDEDLKKIYTPVSDPESYPPEFIKIVWDRKMVRADIVEERRFNDLKRKMAEKGKHFKDDIQENPKS